MESNLAARNLVLRNFKILQSDPETTPIFLYSPLVSFKHDRNLRNSFIRSSLPSNLEPGTIALVNAATHVRPSILKYTFKDPKDRTK